MIRCNVCGIDNGDDSAFCAKCGNRLSNKEAPTSIESTDVRAKKKSHKKAIIAAVSAGLALLVIAVVIVALLLSNAKSEERVFYIKDGELYTRIPGSEDRSVEITDGLMQDSVDAKTMAESIAERADELVYLCSDNETVFYPEELSLNDNSFSLYSTYLGNERNVSVKIASGITEYSILSDGQAVIYRKGNNLYLYDVKKQDSNKIANDTYGYYSNEDGSRIVFLTEGNDVWAFTEGNKSKIATGIDSLEGVIDGCSNFYYMKNGALYKASYMGDNAKIAEDVEEVLEIYNSGEIYYLKRPEKDRFISDYLFDDHLEHGYSGAYENLKKAYEEVTLPEFERKLYYYNPDSEEASLITDSFVKGTEDCSYDQPAMIYECYNSEKFKFFELVQELEEGEIPEEYRGKKGKEAQLEWYYDRWISCLKESVNHFVVVKDKAYNIDVPDAFRYDINDLGNSILAIKGMPESYSEDAFADLYMISLDGGSPQPPSLLAEEIWSYWYGFSEGDEAYYYKNFDIDHNTADLFVGEDRIDEVSLVINHTVLGVNPTEVVYYSDWDNNNSQGTLKLYTDGEKKKIKDDVWRYKVTSSGNLLFLQDFDSKRGRGELFLYKDSETRLVDSDVASIVTLDTYTHKGRRDSRMYKYSGDYWYYEEQAIKEKLQEAAAVASSWVAADITKILSEAFSSIDNHEDYYDDTIVSEDRDYNDYSDNYWDNNYQDSYNTISDATYFMYAYASSELPDQGGHSYRAMNVLYDDDLCWCEGADGYGIGESITLVLPEVQRLYGLKIINGYAGTEKQYNHNSKVKEVWIEDSHGAWGCRAYLKVYDDVSRKNVQYIDFIDLMDEPFETDSITITIEGVDPGDCEDTCLTYIAPLTDYNLPTGYSVNNKKADVEKKTINLWSYTDEVPGIANLYKQLNPSFDYDIKTTIISTIDGAYQPTLDAALIAGGDNAPDIYCVESAFALKYTQGDFSAQAASYSDLGIDVDKLITDADIADYSLDIGTRSSDKKVVALGYQGTGGCFIYRRSIAKDTWGTDDPTVVQDKIGGGSGNWDKFFVAAEELKAKGYAICSGDGDIWHAIENSSDKGWIVDGKLYIDPKREAFLDLSKKLKDNGYHHDTQDWQEGWFADMKKNGGVLGFFGPAWLINYTIRWNCGEGKDSSFGDWAVCNSPVGFFWGGTWILANKNTKASKGVAELIKWITLDYSTNGLQYKWATGNLGGEEGTKDAVTSNAVMRKSNGSLDFLSGQNMYDYFEKANKQAKGNNLTEYDESINSLWRDAVRAYAGGIATRDEAIATFKQMVKDYLGIS